MFVTSIHSSNTNRTLIFQPKKNKQKHIMHFHLSMIQNVKNQGKLNSYYIAVFIQHFTYQCFTYNLSGETHPDESQQKNHDIPDGQL
jgi:hypothetical protein